MTYYMIVEIIFKISFVKVQTYSNIILSTSSAIDKIKMYPIIFDLYK